MSTKTLRKRIALVAVSAMGFGLLTSVGANATTNADAYISNTAGSNAAADYGICAVADEAKSTDTTSKSSTGTVVAVGSTIKFNTTASMTYIVSGPAVFTSSDFLSVDGKTAGGGTSDSKLYVSGTGSIKVTAYDDAPANIATANAKEVFGITAVTACSGDSMNVANSALELIGDASGTHGHAVIGHSDWNAATVKGTPNYADVDSGSTVYIGVKLRDSYKADLLTAGILSASATNGAYISWKSDKALGSTALKSTTGTDTDDVYLNVKQDPNKPGVPLSTVVTIQFNGVTVGTKSVTIYGDPTQLVVSDPTIGNSANSNDTYGNQFTFVVKDAAGNRLEETPAATATIAGVVYGGIVSDVTTAGINPKSYRTSGENSGQGDGLGTFSCASGKSGSQEVSVAFVNAALTTVTSNKFTVTCGSSDIDTFTLSTDKASYAPGEIATLTITAKDANGGAVADNATVGSKITNLSMPGMTQIGTAATATDHFSGGVKTYKFRVDQTEGSYVGQAQVTASTDLSAKTIQYKIAAGGTSITNAEVLAAIVKLIASINKQITALQKLLTKKK